MEIHKSCCVNELWRVQKAGIMALGVQASAMRETRRFGGSMTRFALILLLAVATPIGAQALEQGKNGDQNAMAHRPPPGMCRIWIDGVPAERQPAPTDCATAMRRRPSNARVIFGDELHPRNAPPRQVEARPTEPRPTEPRPTELRPNDPRAADPRTADPRSVEPNTNDPHASEPRVVQPRVARPPRPPVRVPPRTEVKPRKPGGPGMSRIRIH